LLGPSALHAYRIPFWEIDSVVSAYDQTGTPETRLQVDEVNMNAMKLHVLGSKIAVVMLVASVGAPAWAKRKKNKKPVAPPVGWQTEEGWAHHCYYPPDFGAMADGPRRMARSEVLDAMISQWNGDREDGVSFDEEKVMSVETVLLGRPEKIETVSVENLEECKKSATGAGTGAWGSWIKSRPGVLTAGECLTPFTYTMFDYLEIGDGWQRTLPICGGDEVRISGTVRDKYRLSESSPWINVEGDPNQPTLGSAEHECNLEECFAGMLIMRYVTNSGVTTIYAVGSELIFEAPEDGEISYRINDYTFYDNVYYQKGSLIDHTAIEISPAQ